MRGRRWHLPAAVAILVPAILAGWTLTAVSAEQSSPTPSAAQLPGDPNAGAQVYGSKGCTSCHGGPGVEWAKFSEGMHPDPPDLKEVADEEPRIIFWVIKNGINMTGMPSFSKIGAQDNEIWQITAFVKKFGSVKPEDFKAWAGVP